MSPLFFRVCAFFCPVRHFHRSTYLYSVSLSSINNAMAIIYRHTVFKKKYSFYVFVTLSFSLCFFSFIHFITTCRCARNEFMIKYHEWPESNWFSDLIFESRWIYDNRKNIFISNGIFKIFHFTNIRRVRGKFGEIVAKKNKKKSNLFSYWMCQCQRFQNSIHIIAITIIHCHKWMCTENENILCVTNISCDDSVWIGIIGIFTCRSFYDFQTTHQNGPITTTHKTTTKKENRSSKREFGWLYTENGKSEMLN